MNICTLNFYCYCLLFRAQLGVRMRTSEVTDMSNTNQTENKRKALSVKAMCFTGIMAAIIFVFTYTFKIPLGTGYTHLGDTMIFLSIVLLGWKKSCLASGIGAALADLIGGYPAWILPTFAIKLLMVVICGLIAEKLMNGKKLGYPLGTVIGGAFQIGAYTLVKVILYDKAYAVTTLPELAIQTVVGIVTAVVLIAIFNKTNVTARLRKMAE